MWHGVKLLPPALPGDLGSPFPASRKSYWSEDQVREMLDADSRPKLAVHYGKMPESNGKDNWTAMLYVKNDAVAGSGLFDGVTFERSEYPDRVRYAADELRFLIGEIAERPDILEYDADLKSQWLTAKEAELK